MSNSDPSSDALTLNEIARRWGMTRQAVHYFVRRGELQAVRVGPGLGRLWILATEVERFERERGKGSTK